jgi:hypothetical protein
MLDEANEGKKTTVLARVERLRELLEEDAEAAALGRAYREIGRELDGLIRPGRTGGERSDEAAGGEAPPAL